VWWWEVRRCGGEREGVLLWKVCEVRERWGDYDEAQK